jgi:hypothetical protein
MVEWHRQGKAHDSSTRALWQSLQKTHLVAKQEELMKEIIRLALQSITVCTSKRSLTCHKVLRHGTDSFTSPPNEVVLRVFIVLKNSSPTARFKPANLGSNGRHANHYTTEDDESSHKENHGVKVKTSSKATRAVPLHDLGCVSD